MVYLRVNNKDTLLYAFKNIIVGQAYPKTYNNPLTSDTLVVVAKDSLFLNNIYYKKWNLGLKHNGTITDSGFVSVIEGIGSTFGIIAVLRPPFEGNDGLLCFSLNNIVIYPDSTYNCDKTLNVEEHVNKHFFSIYPNPTNDKITIENVARYKDATISIYNIQGQTKLLQILAQEKTEIDLSGLAKGIYILKLSSIDKTEVTKFVKE